MLTNRPALAYRYIWSLLFFWPSCRLPTLPSPPRNGPSNPWTVAGNHNYSKEQILAVTGLADRDTGRQGRVRSRPAAAGSDRRFRYGRLQIRTLGQFERLLGHLSGPGSGARLPRALFRSRRPRRGSLPRGSRAAIRCSAPNCPPPRPFWTATQVHPGTARRARPSPEKVDRQARTRRRRSVHHRLPPQSSRSRGRGGGLSKATR